MPRIALVLLLLASLSATPFDAPKADSRNAEFPVPSAAEYLERLAIAVPPDAPRTFVYTNKRAAYYAGETTGPNRSPNQGLNVYGRKLLDGYRISAGGEALEAAGVRRVNVYPHALVREHERGIREEVSLVDGLNAIVVTVRASEPVEIALEPLIAGGSRPDDFTTRTTDGRIYVTPKIGGDIEQSTPRTIVALAAEPSRATVREAPPTRALFVARSVVVAPTREARFVIAVGRDEKEAATLADTFAVRAGELVAARRSRIAHLLLDSYVETADARFDKALAWAKASADALVTDQAGPGIWAGLYWFNNYWGRDTFISLPGTSLVTGRYEDARAILESFGRYQMTDEKDPLYGRVPNRVNSPTDVIYNTADGTPWFVREAYEYVRASGDLDFAKRFYPTVKRATDGTLAHRVDGEGFLVHDDADTWMDAKWEGRIPWSPRGDRAVDIQALWHAQLEASARLATLAGDPESAKRWTEAATALRAAFRKRFRHPERGVLYDHLNADGTPDAQVRPNQIFALTVPLTPLVTRDEGAPVVRQVVEELTYPYGVASLAQTDAAFHPFHHDERWHFDSAYHNGTVWVWNAGPVVEALAAYGRSDLAYELTSSMVDQTLDMGAVGTLAELIDAIPRDGKLTLSGTETQAWSVAEFVRVFYDAYLGVEQNLLDRTLVVAPALPKRLGTVRAVIPYGRERLKLTVAPSDDGYRTTVAAETLSEPVTLASSEGRKLAAGGEVSWSAKPPVVHPSLSQVGFATPNIVPGLKALAGVPTPVVRLVAAEAVASEPADAEVIFEATDPRGDDRGPQGTYTYPTDSHYEPGILDLTGVRVAADAERYYFTIRFDRLVDPGWHPELGFQLTYVAIALDTDGAPSTGTKTIGKSAGYTIEGERGYERIVYVGGGLELADASGKPLVIYNPSTRDGALGSVAESTIRFSIPRNFLGDATSWWRFAVVAGGQDDGGAAGLGVFRAVKRVAEQWAGGGAATDSAPRVYDVIIQK